MISLKKYLDMEHEKLAATRREADPAEILAATLTSYRAILLITGTSSVRACPPVGTELQKQLAELEKTISGNVTPDLLRETEQKAEDHLEEWGENSAAYLKAKAHDVKELLLALARTAQSIGDRDNRYAAQLTAFTTQLHTVGDLEDLTQIRASLVAGALELKGYVDQMTLDSNSLVIQLKIEVSDYETKLKAAEELVIRDELTGLSNRRNVEERIELRIAKGKTFCIAILDLDSFKQVNDTYGHLAGDSLLKRFAAELRAHSRGHDTVGRWGGDEFIIVLDCDLAGANEQLERTKKWMLGEYKIRTGSGNVEVKVLVTASIGLAQWEPGESLQDVLGHADNCMYTEKGLKKKPKR